MLVTFVLALKITFSEGRVYCQDSNASPWKPLGHPCPITCSTIITAVDRLKITDYQYLLNEEVRMSLNMSAVDLYTIGQQLQENIVYGRKSNTLQPDLRKHIKLFNTYNRLLNNEAFVPALKRHTFKMAAEFNATCAFMAGKKFYKKIMKNNKCTRKLNQRPDVIEKFTKFLNNYADPKYPFDEEMAGIILQKLEGNLNLRYGVVDFKRILSYLRKALRYHKSKTKGDQIIRLKTTDCFNVYLSGCACKTGFVEHKGQCVKPADCITNTVFADYLERIILL